MNGREGRINRRGHPAFALAGILACWVLARATLLELPLVPGAAARLPATLRLAQTSSVPAPMAPRPAQGPAAAALRASAPPAQLLYRPLPAPASVRVGPAPAFEPSPVDTAAGAQLLWLAGVAQTPLPRTVTARLPTPVQFAALPSAARGRWSGDAWLMLRGGSGGLAANGGPAPAYGASQVGAVVRYRLAPDRIHSLAVYIRGAAALAAPGQQEAAIGLAARPAASVPLSAQAELRVTRDAAGTHLRPALALVSELPPLELPAKLRAEAYVQAGYVGGDFASAFVDGQVRVERPIARIGRADVMAGGAVWGGAQRDAARLDAGPTASISDGQLRAAADWRFRLAGDAQPGSGPAITLSAGF